MTTTPDPNALAVPVHERQLCPRHNDFAFDCPMCQASARTHELKTWPPFFEQVVSLRKTFEIRKLDRDYRIGDTLILREWKPETEEYTGLFCTAQIIYMTNWEQRDSHAVLGISLTRPPTDSLDKHYAELQAENKELNRELEEWKLANRNLILAVIRGLGHPVEELMVMNEARVEGEIKRKVAQLAATERALTTAETKAGAMEALNTVLRDALSICRETINLMAYGMSPHARQSCQATLATIERILALQEGK